MTDDGFLAVALLCGCLGLRPSAVVAAPPASAAGPAEVTITVVENPDVLRNKVNTISLPAADEETPQTPKPGKSPTPDKTAEHAKAAQSQVPDRPLDAAESVGDQELPDAGTIEQDIQENQPPEADDKGGPGGP